MDEIMVLGVFGEPKIKSIIKSCNDSYDIDNGKCGIVVKSSN